MKCNCSICIKCSEKELMTHNVCLEVKKEILKDLKEQKKRKEAWRKFSSPMLAEKYNITASTIEYIKRTN